MANQAATQAKGKNANGTPRAPTDLWPRQKASPESAAALRQLLADIRTLLEDQEFPLARLTGPHFRDYHLLDEQGEQIFDMTDDIASRARKIGGTTLQLDQRYLAAPTPEG